MHLVYTLIASGLLVLTDVVAEQPQPPDSYPSTVYAIDYTSTDIVLTSPALLPSYLVLGIPDHVAPLEVAQDDFQTRKPPALSGKRRIQDGPVLRPEDYSPPPTPFAHLVVDDSWRAYYYEPSSLPQAGLAMYYNAEVMQEVLTNRLAMGHVSICNECIGNVALLRAGDLNRRVWLQWADGTIEGPFLVADVAAPHHIPHLLARRWVVDVDYRTAARRGIFGPVPVTVLASPAQANWQTAPPFAPLYSPLPTPTSTPMANQVLNQDE